jgi:hypothetical protein
MYRQSIQFPIKDAGLHEDVHALGTLIGEMLRDQGGEEFFKRVEGDRLAAIRRREGDAAGEAELQGAHDQSGAGGGHRLDEGVLDLVPGGEHGRESA